MQVNRDLLEEVSAVLCAADWDVALLQECPPRWSGPLAVRCLAAGHRVLTSRNSLAPLRSVVARANPDLIASNEGGSNLTLIRLEAARIVARRLLVLRRGPRPERRVMAFTRIAVAGGEAEISVANLHASAGRARAWLAEEEVLLAAERAVGWSQGTPLILGGDLNLRPGDSEIYGELSRRHGLTGPTAPSALDHLLARGLDAVDPPRAWIPERREVRREGLAIRLSDHAPVEAAFALPLPAGSQRRR